MNKKHDEILSLILKQADSCYKVNSTYRGFIVSFFYYNLALIFCEKNCFSRKNEVLKNLANLQEKYYRLINTNTEFSGEFKESNILERLSNNSHVNKLKIIRENCEKKMKSCKVEQEYYYDNVKEIYEDITFKMKQLISNMIIECINEYNKLTQDLPPCDYAFIAFGSMARNEMTPYSDLEFGILILEDKEEYKEYFRQITRLLHFKIINLRETTSRIMGIKLASEIKHLQNLIPNGVSFDGVGIGGCKSPLGRQNENGEVIFELIATPANLAEYQNETYYKENGSLKEEQFLADSIAHITLILEGKKGIKCFPENNEFDNNLVKDYLKKVKNYFNDSASYLWGKKLEIDQGFTKGQVRALELLLKDIERFSPKMGKVERDGRNYSVKHDFYRLLSTVLSHLALYNNIEANNCWEQLKHLKIKLKLKDIHVEKLKKTLDKIGYHRLQAYNYLKEQKEDASDVIEENDNYYKLPLGIVESIYRCLIPFWYASKCFLNLNGNVASNENPEDNLIFDFDHNSNSLLIKGKIIKLLQGSYQAVTFFKKAIDNCNKTNKTIESSRTMVHALYMLASTQLELHPEYVCEAIKNLQLALEETELYSGKMFAEKIDCLLLLSIALKKDDKKSLGCEKNSEELLEEAKLLIKNHYGDQHSFYAQYLSNKGIFEDYFYHLSIDWNIPLTNDKNFVGRQEYLQQLANHFKQTIGCQNLILDSAVGLGGIGKTYLIIQYLHHPQHNYVSRVWFRGDNPQILLKDYRDFAIDKGFLKKNTTISDSELINSVKHYLETYPGWLIIYDNVENYNDIYEYIPSMGGHVIMSSRRAELPPYVKKENWKIMKIEVFSEEDALKYIKKITSYSGNIEEENMKLLAKELGYLPLALAQAASYIKNTKITVADYLDRYYTNKEALLKNKQLPADSENLPVAYTWDISIMHILDNQCYQGDMLEYSTIWNILQVIAYLYPENIPYTLLQEWLNEKNHEQNVVDNKIDIKSCLNILQDYSLIQFSQDKVSIHRLVQEVIRDRFNLVIFEKVKTDFNEEINLKKISQEKNTIYYPIQQAQLLEKKNIYKKSAEELREAISHFDKIEYKNALEIANCHLYLAIALAQNKKIIMILMNKLIWLIIYFLPNMENIIILRNAVLKSEIISRVLCPNRNLY